MKKGFTLIELLAVIAILAIIMLIATPRVLDAINNSKISAYKQDEQMMIKSTKTYFGNNVDLLPENVGDTVEVKLSDLKTNEMISEINDCDGYVLVTKTEAGFSYNPELKCGDANLITNCADDKLVLHYTFDDYLESTTNLYQDSLYTSLPPVIASGAWELTTYQNENVPKLSNYTDNVIKMINLTNHGYWAGEDITVVPNEAYSASVWVYISPDWEGTSVRLSIEYSEGDFAGSTFADVTRKGIWQKIERTGTPTTNKARTLAYVIGQTKGYVLFSDMQLEQKDHPTPFAPDERKITLRDYSLTSNNSSIEILTEPTWEENNGNGYFTFDGIDDYMDINYGGGVDPSVTPQTFSMWVKSNVIGSDKMLISTGQFTGLADPNNRFYIAAYVGEWDMGISGTSWTGAYIGQPVTTKWTHIVVTMDGSVAKMYANGVISRTINYGAYQFNRNIIMGKHDDDAYHFNGSIDELKIYNRALSEQEIKYQYDTQKSIYE